MSARLLRRGLRAVVQCGGQCGGARGAWLPPQLARPSHLCLRSPARLPRQVRGSPNCAFTARHALHNRTLVTQTRNRVPASASCVAAGPMLHISPPPTPPPPHRVRGPTDSSSCPFHSLPLRRRDIHQVDRPPLQLALLERILTGGHREPDPDKADFFYIPGSARDLKKARHAHATRPLMCRGGCHGTKAHFSGRRGRAVAGAVQAEPHASSFCGRPGAGRSWPRLSRCCACGKRSCHGPRSHAPARRDPHHMPARLATRRRTCCSRC
jgi:hypothetical protein